MIRQECFTKEWIQKVAADLQYPDVNLIEKVIRAFSLVELLSNSGCLYIWKGGTALIVRHPPITPCYFPAFYYLCIDNTVTMKFLNTLKWAVTALLAATLAFSCQKNTPVAAPDTYEVAVMDFSTTRGSFHIGGKLYMPHGLEGRKPAVILCHGLFASYLKMEPYAKAAAKMGIMAVCFDFVGGPASESLSDGDIAKDNSVLTEIEDVKAVYDAISSRADVDPSRILVMGASQGGLVSALFAAQYPSHVKALGLFFPAFNLPEYVRTAVNTLFDGDLNMVPEEGVGIDLGTDSYKLNYTFSKKYVIDAYDIQPYEVIGNYKGTVNIIHGDEDIIVPIEYSQNALPKYQNAHLDVIPGQGHTFDENGIKQATAILQKWFPTVL